MRGLYRRNRIWWFRFTCERQRYQVSTGQSDEARAILVARKIKASPALVGAGSLSTEIQSYLASLSRIGRRPNYVANLRDRLLSWARDFESFELTRIGQSDIQRWFDTKLESVLPNTAVAYLDDIRRFFAWELVQKKLRENPAQGLSRPRVKPRYRDRWVNRRVARELIDNCLDLELKYCLLCALHAGMRKDEVIMSRPEWFDLERSVVRIPAEDGAWRPKDGEARSVPLSAKFRAFLFVVYPPRWPFMIGPEVQKGKARYRYDFGRRFNTYVASQGISCSFHDLRRSYASILVSAGLSGYQVAKWLGDDMRQLEQAYGHLEPNGCEEINRVLL